MVAWGNMAAKNNQNHSQDKPRSWPTSAQGSRQKNDLWIINSKSILSSNINLPSIFQVFALIYCYYRIWLPTFALALGSGCICKGIIITSQSGTLFRHKKEYAHLPTGYVLYIIQVRDSKTMRMIPVTTHRISLIMLSSHLVPVCMLLATDCPLKSTN